MKLLNILKEYWVIIAAIIAFTSSLAIGNDKLKTVEEAIKTQIEQNKQVQLMQTEQKVLVERTKHIVKSLDEQKAANIELQRVLLQVLAKVNEPPN